MAHTKDLTGLQFGKLTAIKIKKSIPNNRKDRHTKWVCSCSCGYFSSIVSSNNLQHGKVKSCGCVHNKGHMKFPLRKPYKTTKKITWNYAVTKGWVKKTKQKRKTRKRSTSYKKWEGLINTYGIRCTSICKMDINNKCQFLKVRCHCGKLFKISKANFRRQKSCGCSKKFKNLKGIRYGKLVVLNFAHQIKHQKYWNCICDDGNRCIATSHNLLRGNVKSCGCLQKETLQQAKKLKLKNDKGGSKARQIIKKLNTAKAGLIQYGLNWDQATKIVNNAQQIIN